MDISKLYGNGAAAKRLQHDTLFHAYIISGGSAAERSALAKAIAAAAVCSAEKNKPCNTCENCRKANAGIHPDVVKITRQDGKRDIYVNQIREIKADAAILPNEAEKKVYIVEEADTMNTSAQNAMLKVLEEPPSYVVFVLLAENPRILLSTVRSRCVELNLTPQAGGGEPAEDAGLDNARRFLDIMESGDKMALLSFLFQHERLEKEELKKFALSVRRLVLERMRAGNAGGSLDRKELLHIAAVFFEVQRYTDANVNTGHAINLLLAEFA